MHHLFEQFYQAAQAPIPLSLTHNCLLRSQSAPEEYFFEQVQEAWETGQAAWFFRDISGIQSTIDRIASDAAIFPEYFA